MRLDLRVYVITTRLPHLGRDHFTIAEAAVRGGATILQFRDKTMPDAEFAVAASRILCIAGNAGHAGNKSAEEDRSRGFDKLRRASGFEEHKNSLIRHGMTSSCEFS